MRSPTLFALLLFVTCLINAGTAAEATLTSSDASNQPRSGSVSTAAADAVEELGFGAYQTGNYREAVKQFKQALSLEERLLGSDDQELVPTLNILGSAERELGHFKAAIADHERALNILTGAQSPDSGLLALTHCALGSANQARGAHDTARQNYEKAIQLSRNGRGLQSRAMISTLLNLSRVYMERNQLQIAEAQLKRAHALLRPQSKENIREWMEYLDTKAAFLYYQGKYAQAETNWRDAQSLAEQHLGPEHPNVLVILAHRAELHLLLREQDQAIELFEKCLRLRERTLGENHPDVAMVLAHLAILHGRRHEEVKAAELYEKAIRILRADTSSNALYLGLTLRYQGEFQRANSAWPDAAHTLGESLEFLQTVLGDNHPIVGQTMISYAAVLKKCKRKSDAKRYEERARMILDESDDTTRALRNTVDIRSLQRTARNY